jgi:hypothetical protein
MAQLDHTAHVEQLTDAIAQARRTLSAEQQRWEKEGSKDPRALLGVIEGGEELIKSLEEPEKGRPRFIGQPQRQLKDELRGARAMMELARQNAERAKKPRY